MGGELAWVRDQVRRNKAKGGTKRKERNEINEGVRGAVESRG